jgi:hypothetical protein
MLDATWEELKQALEVGKHGLSCFWGNLLRYALRWSYADDPRTKAVVRLLVHDAQAGWRCPHNDGLPCAWGVARAMWELAALRAQYHAFEVETTVRSGLTFLLEEHSLIRADYPSPGRVHHLWSRLNFPLFYQTDILFVLRVLVELRAFDHHGAQPVLEWLSTQRRADGQWRGTSPFRQRTWVSLADQEELDYWVSLQAAIVLQKAHILG